MLQEQSKISPSIDFVPSQPQAYLLLFVLQLPQVMLVPGLHLMQHLLVRQAQLHYLQRHGAAAIAATAAAVLVQGRMQPHIHASQLLLLLHRLLGALRCVQPLHLLPKLISS
jgi:hypothetical protein